MDSERAFLLAVVLGVAALAALFVLPYLQYVLLAILLAASILSLSGFDDQWAFRVLFPDRDALSATYEFCRDRNPTFDLRQVYEVSNSSQRGHFGLTDERHEALVAGLECGYFDVPRRATMDDLPTSRSPDRPSPNGSGGAITASSRVHSSSGGPTPTPRGSAASDRRVRSAGSEQPSFDRPENGRNRQVDLGQRLSRQSRRE